ncbi:hypothetical protein FNV43_RR05614 [Rhamnella rubrinervis]|uniref:Uncharacterized protein n=1 Tax=Rhamnella rubrinervis TaxID=2594499 RepID=A0A8K0MQL4_9ROSA|nr:hypothetical protein FNV43_RR05614 [Rhamnella rubrinervis]
MGNLKTPALQLDSLEKDHDDGENFGWRLAASPMVCHREVRAFCLPAPSEAIVTGGEAQLAREKRDAAQQREKLRQSRMEFSGHFSS